MKGLLARTESLQRVRVRTKRHTRSENVRPFRLLRKKDVRKRKSSDQCDHYSVSCNRHRELEFCVVGSELSKGVASFKWPASRQGKLSLTWHDLAKLKVCCVMIKHNFGTARRKFSLSSCQVQMSCQSSWNFGNHVIVPLQPGTSSWCYVRPHFTQHVCDCASKRDSDTLVRRSEEGIYILSFQEYVMLCQIQQTLKGSSIRQHLTECLPEHVKRWESSDWLLCYIMAAVTLCIYRSKVGSHDGFASPWSCKCHYVCAIANAQTPIELVRVRDVLRHVMLLLQHNAVSHEIDGILI